MKNRQVKGDAIKVSPLFVSRSGVFRARINQQIKVARRTQLSSHLLFALIYKRRGCLRGGGQRKHQYTSSVRPEEDMS
ncbi:hypothetical protein GCM10007906_05320 [Vibrio hyugaensis]|uniref:Uncharacterized protein n=1 Tax=Vibrio hyugaensis TaxID=1534743 RepID=A0ABQ5XYI2_9VIBR|nr:hypothetical protein GCM10007906_05320 [Vibrio hyugaensis]